MTEVTNAYQRMLVACSIIDGQPWVKDLSNSQYKSIPVDAMRAGVRKACVQAGLVHTGPDDLRIERERSADGRTVRFYATCTFHYFNVDNPEDVISFESAGEAMDNGDKGTGKVVTNLIKNHYKSAFDIGEQEDKSDDEDEPEDVDAYSNGEYYAKVEKQKQKEAKAAQDRQMKVWTDTLTDWMLNDILVAGIVGTYSQRHGLMDTWDRDTLKVCYDECLKAREGSQ